MITAHTDIVKILPDFLYKILAQQWIDYEYPRHIFIETTANCNLTCSYCPRENIKDSMDYELFKEIINEASNYGPRSFSLHLFGEPLLYPRILEAIKYIKEKNSRNTVLLTTNGTLLNKFAKELEKTSVDRIIWSYRNNKFNEDSLRLLRKRGLIRILIEETPKEEFEKWSRFPRVEIKHLHNYGGNIDTKTWGIKDDGLSTRWPCYHLWLAPAIRWNGAITICCNSPHQEPTEKIYGTGHTVHDFWTGRHLASIREQHMKGKYEGICKGCNSFQAYKDIWFKSQKEV